MSERSFLIERDASGTVNSVEQTGRVYVTGPHFSRDIFSSTRDRAKATRYSEDEAKRLVTTKWRHLNPVAVQEPPQ